jgi:hypothetical protein
MKRFLGTILVIIFFAACTKSLPEGIVSEKEMTDILFDMHIADGYMNTVYSHLSQKQANPYTSIYKKYNIDSVQFRHNLEYYSEQPQVFQDIYAEISKRLHSTEKSIIEEESKKQLAILKLDSIKTQRKKDSLNLRKRDSILFFNGKRDLFISVDSLRKSQLSDSLYRLQDSIFRPIINEQRRWEMIFLYFNKSNFNPLLKSSTNDSTDLPPKDIEIKNKANPARVENE